LIDAGINEEVEDDCAELWANTLWNSLGAAGDTSPDVFRIDLQLGDTLLFCTDGLTKHVRDDAIHEALSGNDEAEVVCQNLTSAANDDGGSDNITLVVARFLDSEEAKSANAEEALAPPEVSPDELSELSTIDQIKVPNEILEAPSPECVPNPDDGVRPTVLVSRRPKEDEKEFRDSHVLKTLKIQSASRNA
jgi:hypothetical protein